MVGTQGLGRYPPVYDFEDLKRQIREIVGTGDLDSRLYQPTSSGPPVCQGDVIELRSPRTYISDQGLATAEWGSNRWMVLANTCDLTRSIETIRWAHLVPLIAIRSNQLREDELSALRGYRYHRRFYLPPWPDGDQDVHHTAEFTQPVTVHRAAIENLSEVQARLSFLGWVLLNSCLLRFLARDDGRGEYSGP